MMQALNCSFCLIVFFAASLMTAHAEVQPKRGNADGRIRTVYYNQSNVVAVDAALGVSTMIILGEHEKVETVAVGDSISWKIEPNKKGNVIFVKPIEKGAETNMNIVSDKRIYSFILRTTEQKKSDHTFMVKFTYGDDDAALLEAARQLTSTPNLDNLISGQMNKNYQFRGDRSIKPMIAFDDGVKTWFQFTGPIPAIFAIEDGMNETLVNHRREGQYIVVDKVARQWVIRKGKLAICIFNMKMPSPGSIPIAPSTLVEMKR